MLSHPPVCAGISFTHTIRGKKLIIHFFYPLVSVQIWLLWICIPGEESLLLKNWFYFIYSYFIVAVFIFKDFLWSFCCSCLTLSPPLLLFVSSLLILSLCLMFYFQSSCRSLVLHFKKGKITFILHSAHCFHLYFNWIPVFYIQCLNVYCTTGGSCI